MASSTICNNLHVLSIITILFQPYDQNIALVVTINDAKTKKGRATIRVTFTVPGQRCFMDSSLKVGCICKLAETIVPPLREPTAAWRGWCLIPFAYFTPHLYISRPHVIRGSSYWEKPFFYPVIGSHIVPWEFLTIPWAGAERFQTGYATYQPHRVAFTMPEDSVAILIVEDDNGAYPSFGTLPASHAQYGFRLLRGIFFATLVIWTVVWLKLLRDALL